MTEFLIGLVLLALGLSVAFLGARMYFVFLPVWGFFSGFFTGAGAIHSVLGEGFLGTVTGWIAGFIVAVVFATFAYLYWYAGGVLLAGTVGALAGSGLLALFGVSSGWAILLVALVAGVLSMVAAWRWHLPVYMLIVNSSFAGSVAAVAGLVLMLNRITLDELRLGAAWATIHDGWHWLLAWVVIAALGIRTQLSHIDRTRLPASRWTRVVVPSGGFEARV